MVSWIHQSSDSYLILMEIDMTSGSTVSLVDKVDEFLN